MADRKVSPEGQSTCAIVANGAKHGRDKPWLAHYDADVPRSLSSVPGKTLLDYLARSRATTARRPALLFKGASMSYGAARTRERCVCGRAGRDRRAARRSRRADAAELPAVLGRRVRRLEGRRHCRRAESDLHASASWKRRSRPRGADTVVTLTPFYGRVKERAAHERACAP